MKKHLKIIVPCGITLLSLLTLLLLLAPVLTFTVKVGSSSSVTNYNAFQVAFGSDTLMGRPITGTINVICYVFAILIVGIILSVLELVKKEFKYDIICYCLISLLALAAAVLLFLTKVFYTNSIGISTGYGLGVGAILAGIVLIFISCFATFYFLQEYKKN